MTRRNSGRDAANDVAETVPPRTNYGLLTLALAIALLAGVLFWLNAGGGDDNSFAFWENDGIDGTDVRELSELPVSGEVMYCASCHALPSPDILPKAQWPQTIERMNLVIEYHRLGQPLTPELLDRITGWYVEHAPAQVSVLTDEGSASPIHFAPSVFGDATMATADGGPPQIGHLRIVDLDGSGEPRVLISDIGNRTLFLAERDADGRWTERALASIDAPAQVAVADVNGNGHLDIVVADLGSIRPTNDLVGRVVLLENDGEMNFTLRTLMRDQPRMSDVQVTDLNGNGRPDILFAAFGLYRNGQIGWLEQTDDGEFLHHAIFLSNGVSHVRVTDLTGDGRPDFIALVSQEHQEVLAFINEGDGYFERHVLHKAPHPMWGYASLELVDLNGNGRLDVLLANGDAFDLEHAPKRWHGVQWLENQGDLTFTVHDLFKFHGAYTAVPADLTGDGHLDIVVSSMANYWDQPGRQSVIWLENDGQQNFTPRRLAQSPTSLITVAAGDLTGDGRADIIAGGLYDVIPRAERFGRVTIWENQGPRAPAEAH